MHEIILQVWIVMCLTNINSIYEMSWQDFCRNIGSFFYYNNEKIFLTYSICSKFIGL
jgi:hypothetical protein